MGNQCLLLLLLLTFLRRGLQEAQTGVWSSYIILCVLGLQQSPSRCLLRLYCAKRWFTVLLQFWKCQECLKRSNNFVGNPPKIHVLTVILCELRTQVKDDPSDALRRYWVSRDDKFILEILIHRIIWVNSICEHIVIAWIDCMLNVCSCQVQRRGGVSDMRMEMNHECRSTGSEGLASAKWVWARRFHLPPILRLFELCLNRRSTEWKMG